MKRPMIAALLAGGVLLGGGVAYATSTGDVHLNTSAAHYDGSYNFYGSRSSRPRTWNTTVAGRFRNTEDDHVYLKAHIDGYGDRTFAQIAGDAEKKDIKANFTVNTGDTLVANSLTVAVCESHWGPDECDDQTYYRNS